jgi:Tol biopolymer transport system component
MDRTGNRLRALTTGDGAYTTPRWSSDGQRVFFFAIHTDALYEINADGTGLRSLTGMPEAGSAAMDIALDLAQPMSVYSPDRLLLAYFAFRDNQWGLYVGREGRVDERLLINTGRAFGEMPVWSPDGRQLAFVSRLHGMTDVYAIDAHAGNSALRRLTVSPLIDAFPTWRPR